MTAFQPGHCIFKGAGGRCAKTAIVGVRITVLLARLPTVEVFGQNGRPPKHRRIDESAVRFGISTAMQVVGGVMHGRLSSMNVEE